MTARYKVDGMTCGGCARAVTRAITQQYPNTSVGVDLETGVVTVEDDVPGDAVRAAVEGAGFGFSGPLAG